MGLDVEDLNLCVSVGFPKTVWKLRQQAGRIGRNGQPAIEIVIGFPQKGRHALTQSIPLGKKPLINVILLVS